MNRYLIPLTLTISFAAIESSSAQDPHYPPPPPPQVAPQGMPPVEYGPVYDPGYVDGGSYPNAGSPYGWNRPLLRAWTKHQNRHNCPGYPYYGPGGPGAGVMGPPVQGTLVFPKHPFVRSPRDFFMQN